MLGRLYLKMKRPKKATASKRTQPSSATSEGAVKTVITFDGWVPLRRGGRRRSAGLTRLAGGQVRLKLNTGGLPEAQGQAGACGRGVVGQPQAQESAVHELALGAGAGAQCQLGQSSRSHGDVDHVSLRGRSTREMPRCHHSSRMVGARTTGLCFTENSCDVPVARV
jgi:hypothetical protein